MFTRRCVFRGGFAVLIILVLAFARPETVLAQGPRQFNTVIVDAGHGGYDPGGILGVRTQPAEKQVTLDVARRLARALRARGFRVVMTRSDDTFVSLGQRVAPTYQGLGAAVFVSIHFNAAMRSGARGIETYYYRSDSLGLAARVHRALLAATGAEDRFVRRRGFFVIRRSAVPAVLCECGFLTNPDENRLASRPDYQQKLAGAIGDAVAAQRTQGNPANLPIPLLQSPTSHVYHPGRKQRRAGGRRHRH